MSLARDLIDAALAGDLSQNELRVFLALFRQTLCFGKVADPLNMKRLAAISGVRKDRLNRALARVVGLGIFDAVEHQVFGFEYSIPESFLAQYPDGFFVPALPKNGGGFHFSGEVSEKRVHTSYNLTPLTNTPTTTSSPAPTPAPDTVGGGGGVLVTPGKGEEEAVGLPYPAGFGEQGRKRAAQILDGLSPDDARDCLLVLGEKMEARKVKSPLGFLHQLAKAARTGCLDRSALKGETAGAGEPYVADMVLRVRQIVDEIRGLDSLAALAGSMDSVTAWRRATLLGEYNHLKSVMQTKQGSGGAP